LLLITALVSGAVILFMAFEGMGFGDALYLTVTTVTTLGYGDVSPTTPGGRGTAMALATSGLLLVFGVGVEVVKESFAQTISGRDRRMERLLAEIRGHHIVCGFGRLGERIAEQFMRLGQQVVIVERDAAAAAHAAEHGHPVVHGDALEHDSLVRAGIARARTVVASFSNDADNVYLTLECRELRRDIEVICTASGREAARRMYLAGATRVVSPQTVAAEMVAKSAVNPAVIQLMSEVTDATAMSENLTQIVVAPSSELVGKTLAQLPRLGVNVKVVASKHGGSLTIPQAGDFSIRAGALLVVARPVDQLQKLERLSRGQA
jgi:voltage-gated potassium channel